MVAETVEVITKSYQDGAEAVRWTCDGTTSYTLEKGERENRGTDIILHVTEEDQEFLEPLRIKNILNKYGKFLPIEIEFEDQVINNPNPIWKKAPTELEDKDYLDFFKELYPMSEEPLFWIHLNVDFPFNLTGVLYFPKIRQDIDPKKNNIQLYSRQVFITDEVNQIVPEYLMLLQGVIDSPDIPLNVSRSYLQGDANVRKISNYITRKVADKLHEIFKEDRGRFEEKWKDISVFVKYGMLTDDKFYERAEKFCLFGNVDNNYFTLEEYREKVAKEQTDKDENVVYLYTSHPGNQDMFIRAAEKKGYDVLSMDGAIDSHFIGLVERKIEKSRWVRVDSDTLDNLIPKEAPVEEEGGEGKAKKGKKKEKAEIVLTEEQETNIKVNQLGADTLPVMLTRPEFMRRMREMAAAGGGGGMNFMGEMPDTVNVVINSQHPLVAGMVDKEDSSELAKQLMDLALLSQNMLEGKDLTDFIHRSVDMMGE
ncbi:UNVERIFIED_CONTAM: hypothetical protein GTU68_029036 [Idotea baltica]|nr:hypothetical protein [Idotea baltica]